MADLVLYPMQGIDTAVLAKLNNPEDPFSDWHIEKGYKWGYGERYGVLVKSFASDDGTYTAIPVPILEELVRMPPATLRGLMTTLLNQNLRNYGLLK
jgi:hypothetical protein